MIHAMPDPVSKVILHIIFWRAGGDFGEITAPFASPSKYDESKCFFQL